MRIVPFPNRGEATSREGRHAELAAALEGDGVGAGGRLRGASCARTCERWRRAMDPEFDAPAQSEDRDRGATPATQSAATAGPARRARRPGWLSALGRRLHPAAWPVPAPRLMAVRRGARRRGPQPPRHAGTSHEAQPERATLQRRRSAAGAASHAGLGRQKRGAGALHVRRRVQRPRRPAASSSWRPPSPWLPAPARCRQRPTVWLGWP